MCGALEEAPLCRCAFTYGVEEAIECLDDAAYLDGHAVERQRREITRRTLRDLLLDLTQWREREPHAEADHGEHDAELHEIHGQRAREDVPSHSLALVS